MNEHDQAEFVREVRGMVKRWPEQREAFPPGPRQADVDGLRGLLDLTDGWDNDQRARFILTSNWFRDHGAAAGAWADPTFTPYAGHDENAPQPEG